MSGAAGRQAWIDAELAARIEAADAQSLAALVRLHLHSDPEAEGDVLAVAGGWAVFSELGRQFCQARGLGLEAAVGDDDLRRIEAFYDGCDGACRITLCPYADPTLIELTSARGYTIEELTNVWAQPLDASTPGPEPTPGLTIEAVDARMTSGWAHTVASGFAGKGGPSAAAIGLFELIGRSEGTVCYLARLASRPCGGAAMHLRDGVARLFAASVLAGCRGRGVHRALIGRRAADAAAMGCDLAVIQALPGRLAERNAQRGGFHLAYTRPTLVGP